MELGEQVQRREPTVSYFLDGYLRGLMACRVDIPVQALNLYFNGWWHGALHLEGFSLCDNCLVTHPIVSQANPHVHLFFFAPQGSAGKPVAHRKGKGTGRLMFIPFFPYIPRLRPVGWRGNFLLSAAEQWLKLELTKNFKVCDLRSPEGILDLLMKSEWIAHPRPGPASTIARSRLVERFFAAI